MADQSNEDEINLGNTAPAGQPGFGGGNANPQDRGLGQGVPNLDLENPDDGQPDNAENDPDDASDMEEIEETEQQRDNRLLREQVRAEQLRLEKLRLEHIRRPLVAERKQIRIQITKSTNRLEVLIRNKDPAHERWNPMDYGAVISIRTHAVEKCRGIRDLDQEIARTFDPTIYTPKQINDEATMAEAYQFRYSDLINACEGFEAEGEANVVMLSTPSRPSTSAPATPSTPGPAFSAKIKLPAVDIPSFDGQYINWPSFADQWEAVIDRNSTLEKANKLYYLKQAVKGDALKMISPLSSTSANYEIAWDMLRKRYENTRLITAKHLDALLNMPPAKGESAVYLRKISETFQLNVHQLKNQGQELCDFVLVHILIGKMDSETRKYWELKQSSVSTTPSYADLISFIETRSRALEAAHIKSETAPKNDSKIKVSGNTRNQKGSFTQSYVNSTDHESDVPPSNVVFAAQSAKPRSSGARASRDSVAQAEICAHCDKKGHKIFNCNDFKKATIDERRKLVRAKGLCYNCMNKGHAVTKCKSAYSCKVEGCGSKFHNTLLHVDPAPPAVRNHLIEVEKPLEITKQVPLAQHCANDAYTTTILATALVPLCDYDNNRVYLRALLDNGSQSCFITENGLAALRLVRQPCLNTVTGLGSERSKGVKGCVQVTLNPCSNEDMPSFIAMVLQKITGNLPTEEIIWDDEDEPIEGMTRQKLADPFFDKPNSIDLLIGADMYYTIVKRGRADLKSGITLLETMLGWAVTGPLLLENEGYSNLANSFVVTSETPDISRFWEVEEVSLPVDHPASAKLTQKSKTEGLVVQHYLDTTTTHESGAKIVDLPFLPDAPKLGFSKFQAEKRWYATENQYKEDPIAFQDYIDFIKEMLDMGHLELVPESELEMAPEDCFYIPHHGIRKDASTTTKFRVVFDGSAKSSSGRSLNDNLMVGPKIQDDLYHIMCRFRLHRVALTADITKMYRMVKLSQKSANFQRIFFRESPDLPLQTYRITVVIYGTANASFHAVNTLRNSSENALCAASKSAIEEDFYIDDCVTGAAGIDEAIKLQNNVATAVATCGFELRKWASSVASVVNTLPDRLREHAAELPIGGAEHEIKTLGIVWTPNEDMFQYKVIHLDQLPTSAKDDKKVMRRMKRSLIPDNSFKVMTKRKILADLAKFFDPLGLISPATIRLKMCMQQIWVSKAGWDEELSQELTAPFFQWRNLLPQLRDLKIPRCVLGEGQTSSIELHMFSDASEAGMGACIYTVVTDDCGTKSVNLLTAKTKVAPLKSVTIPRLELQAMLVGTRLLKAVLHSLRRFNLEGEIKIFGWTDATICLHWVSKSPGVWSTFVANRVCEIQDLLPRELWRHVPTAENPADCASRGMAVDELKDHKLWWHGPEFLTGSVDLYPDQPADLQSCSEESKKIKAIFAAPAVKKTKKSKKPIKGSKKVKEIPPKDYIGPLDLTKHSSLSYATNKLAWVTRAAHIWMHKVDKTTLPSFLTTAERQNALMQWVRAYQQANFGEEIAELKKSGTISKKSPLLKLYPFVDPDDDILKVGGRLAFGDTLPESQRFPAILPKGCHLSYLLARQVHTDNLHGGLNLCMSELRRNFWVISSRALLRQIIANCVKCYKFNSRQQMPLMGDLPKERITPSPPFTHTGLDFAGPFLVKGKTKNDTSKVWVAIFVCFSTKAVHFEVVSGLTSVAAIASLRRFCARRGAPAAIYSDNGTNFVGARRELAQMQAILEKDHGPLAKSASDLGINWQMIPPGAPHFGGLWEAAVKSAKSHMKKTMGLSVFTFEELVTLMCSIESILNSRPLCEVSHDANDLEALTPQMLLTGKRTSTMALPDPKPLATKLQLMIKPQNRWLYVNNLAATFWKRWSTEYIGTLQLRKKWATETVSLVPGDMVLVADENQGPLHWPLGRVVKTFTGEDNIARAVLIRTAKGEFKRPAHKLRKLPFDVPGPAMPQKPDIQKK